MSTYNAKQRLANTDTVFIDGDTAVVNGKRIRLSGYDAPETYHEGTNKGWSISGDLAALVADSTEQEIRDTGKRGGYGRGLGTLHAPEGKLTSNEKLIRAGVGGEMFFGEQNTLDKLPEDVQSAIRTRDSNRWNQLEDSDPEVREIRKLNQNLNRLAGHRALFGVDPYADNIKTSNSKWAVTRALERGTDQMQGNLYGAAAALADVFGADDMKKWAEKGVAHNELVAKYNPASVPTTDDIHSFGDLITWGVERIAEELPSLAVDAGVAAASAATGGGVAVLAGTASAGKWASRGAKAGVALSSVAQNTGDAYSAMDIAGVGNGKGLAALGTGLAMGVLDYAGLMYGVKAVSKPLGITDGIAKEAAENVVKGGFISAAKDVAKDVAKTAGKNFLVEGTTEAAQEAVKDVGVTIAGGDTDKLGPLAWRMKESFFAGGVVGGGNAGAGRTGHHAIDAIRSKKEANQARDAKATEDTPVTGDNTHVNSQGKTTEGKTSADYNPNFEDIETERGFSKPNPTPPQAETVVEPPQVEPVTEPVAEEPVNETAVEPLQPEPVNEPVTEPNNETADKPLPEQQEVDPPAFSKDEAESQTASEPEPALKPETKPKHSFTNPKGYNLRKVYDSAVKENDDYIPEPLKSEIKNILFGGVVSERQNQPSAQQAAVDAAMRNPETAQKVLQLIDDKFIELRKQQEAAPKAEKGVDEAARKQYRKLERAVEDIATFRDKVKDQHARGELNFDSANRKAGGTIQNAALKTILRDMHGGLADEDIDTLVAMATSDKPREKHQAIITALKKAHNKRSDEDKKHVDDAMAEMRYKRTRRLMNAVIYKNSDELDKILADHYQNSARNKVVAKALLTTKAKNLTEFAQYYGDGKFTEAQVYDHIDDAYFVDRFKATQRGGGDTHLYTSQDDGILGRVDGTAPITKNIDTTPTKSKAAVAPKHVRPATKQNKNDDVVAVAEYVDESVEQLTRMRPIDFDSEYADESKMREYGDDPDEVPVDRVKVAKGGFDFNNPRRLEALKIYTDMKIAEEKHVRAIYEELLEKLPSEIRAVKMAKDGKAPLHLIKAALKKDLPSIIERRETASVDDFAQAVSRQVDRGFIAGGLQNMRTFGRSDADVTAAANNQSSAALQRFTDQHLAVSDVEVDDLAERMNVSPQAMRKALDFLDKAAFEFVTNRSKNEGKFQHRINFDHHKTKKAVETLIANTADVQQATELEALFNKPNVIKRMAELFNGREKAVFSQETIEDALEQLNKQDFSGMLPEEIQERLRELGILSYPKETSVFGLPTYAVNRYGTVAKNTPLNEIGRFHMSDGTVKHIRLSKLADAISDKLSKDNYGSPAQLLVDSVTQVVGTLKAYRESTGRRIVDVEQTINALHSGFVIFRSDDGVTLTIADYRTARDRIKSIQNKSGSTTPHQRVRDDAHAKMRRSIKNAPEVFKDLHVEDVNPFNARIERIAKITGMAQDDASKTLSKTVKVLRKITAANAKAKPNPIANHKQDIPERLDHPNPKPVQADIPVKIREAKNDALRELEINQASGKLAPEVREKVQKIKQHTPIDDDTAASDFSSEITMGYTPEELALRAEINDAMQALRDEVGDAVIAEAVAHINYDRAVKADESPKGRRQTTLNDVVTEALERENTELYIAEGKDILDDMQKYAEILHGGAHQESHVIAHAREQITHITKIIGIVREHLRKLNRRKTNGHLVRESQFIAGSRARGLSQRLGNIVREYYTAREAQQAISNIEYQDKELQQINGRKSVSIYTEERSLRREHEKELAGKEAPRPTLASERFDQEFESERGRVIESEDPATRYLDVKPAYEHISANEARREIIKNREHGGEMVVYSVEEIECGFEPVVGVHLAGKPFARGKTLSSMTPAEVKAQLNQHNGKLTVYFGQEPPAGALHSIKPINVMALADAAGHKTYDGLTPATLYADVFGEEPSISNGEVIATLANHFADSVQEINRSFDTALDKQLRTDEINYFDGNPNIRFYQRLRAGGDARPAFTAEQASIKSGDNRMAVTPTQKRSQIYRALHDVIQSAGIKQKINVLFDGGIGLDESEVYTTIEDGQPVYNIRVPREVGNDMVGMAIGHELGHIILDPYRNAAVNGTLNEETATEFKKLYGDALAAGNELDAEAFADSFAQLFMKQIAESIPASKDDRPIKSLVERIYDQLKALGNSVADYLKSAVSRFNTITGRKTEVNTAEHEKFLNELLGQRDFMDPHTRAVNERLLGKGILRNPEARGKTILHTLNLFRHLRPVFSRLKAVSPAIAELFLSTKGKDGYQNVKTNLLKVFNGDVVRPEGLRSTDKKASRRMEIGYQDLLAGKDTADSRLYKQYVENISQYARQELDPNNIGAYGMRPYSGQVPYRLNPGEVQRHEAEVRQILEGLGVQNVDILIDSAIRDTDPPEDSENSKKIKVSWQPVLSLPEVRLALDKFMDKNGVTVMNSYIHNLSHQLGMRVGFGAHARDIHGRLVRDDFGMAQFRPMVKLNKYFELLNADERTVVIESLQVISGDYEALYPTGRVPEWFRQTTDVINTVGNLAVLTFAGLNNIMDIAVPLMTSGDIGNSLKALGKFFSGHDREQIVKFAKALGVVEYGVMKNTMNALTFGRNRTGLVLDKVSDAFFLVTLMTHTTKASRLVATSVAVQGINDAVSNPSKNNQAFLEKIGLTEQDAEVALRYIAQNGGDINVAFNPAPNTDPFTMESLRNYKNAVSNFVSFSTLDPNALTDPMIASNPWFGLLTNLKRFFYAFHHTVLKGLATDTARRYNEANGLTGHLAIGVPLASTALFMLPMALFSWWLREWVRDGDIDKGNPFDLPLSELIAKGYQRAGALGLGDIIYNADQSHEYGTPWLLTPTPSLATFWRAGEALYDNKPASAAKTLLPLWNKTYLTSPGKWFDDE